MRLTHDEFGVDPQSFHVEYPIGGFQPRPLFSGRLSRPGAVVNFTGGGGDVTGTGEGEESGRE